AQAEKESAQRDAAAAWGEVQRARGQAEQADRRAVEAERRVTEAQTESAARLGSAIMETDSSGVIHWKIARSSPASPARAIARFFGV
ncbi:hypothetical protein AB0C69_27525, partial [Actinomadura sp. NPDC048032]|uniref:hypothetical protein n=1 Tax=Actinomadura sp. NPDC048032 TaxID=3155747 RepID=UPI0033EA3B98